MSATKKTATKKAPPKVGDVEWSVRGRGAIPTAIGGGGEQLEQTNAELAALVDSLAYRVLELIPTLTHEEIIEAVAGVDADDPLMLFVLQKQEGAFGTLDTMDGSTWVEGLGPQLVGKMHGGGTYQLRVQARQNGIRKFIKQPMFRVPGRVASATPTPSSSDGGVNLLAQITAIVGIVTPLVKAFITDRAPAPAPDPASFVRMFREGLELGKESAKVKNDGDEGFGRTLRELVPPALGMFREIAASSSGGAPAAPAPQLPPVAAAAAPAGPPPPSWVVILAPHVPELMKLARVFADPEHWAAQVLPMIDDGQLTFLAEQLERGDAWRSEFFQYFPETIPHRAWFDRFFNAVDLELEDEEDGELEQRATE